MKLDGIIYKDREKERKGKGMGFNKSEGERRKVKWVREKLKGEEERSG